jgi:hypothetical protein
MKKPAIGGNAGPSWPRYCPECVTDWGKAEVSMSKKSTLDATKAEKVAKVEADLDEALDESFPASDPPSMAQPRSGTDATHRRLTKRSVQPKK